MGGFPYPIRSAENYVIIAFRSHGVCRAWCMGVNLNSTSGEFHLYIKSGVHEVPHSDQ